MADFDLISHLDGRHLITSDKLIAEMKSKGFYCQEVSSFFIKNENMAIVGSNDLASMVSFAKSIGVTTLFFEYYNFSKEDLLITENMTEYYEDEYVNLIKNEILEYNLIIETLDFSFPVILRVFILYEGHVFGVNLEDPELCPISLSDPSERLDSMINNKDNDKIEIAKEEIEKRNKKLEEDLKNIIVLDENFKSCTNQNLRISYVERLLSKEENKKYEDLFKMGHSNSINRKSISYFIDPIWAELKKGKK